MGVPATFPTVIEGGNGEVAPIAIVPAEIPAPPEALAGLEATVWEHVTGALLRYGLVHLTDQMALMVIVRTFRRWLDAERQLQDFMDEHDGSFIVTTPNGYEQPHQLFHVCSRLKKELLTWLPEAALTIPSFAKLKAEEIAASRQGALFDDPVELFRKRRAAIGLRLVDNDDGPGLR
jgi:hypothetical protein